MNQLGQFEQNLLAELREFVAERTAVPQPRSRKRLVLATAGGGLCYHESLVEAVVGVARDEDTITLRSADLEGRTLVVESRRLASPDPDGSFVIYYSLADGPGAPCELVDLSEE